MASYTFDDTFYGYNKRSSARKEDDGNVSLTYSAASGESTDSSFAGIMRALDLKDSEYVLKKEGSPEKFSSNMSLSEYSTDGESYLAGSELLQTIAG
jgi:putative salt-induced outer membrane protein YdiY